MTFNWIEFISSIFQFSAGTYLKETFSEFFWVSVAVDVAGIFMIATIPLLMVFVVGWTERKVLARMQDRIGPNRVGGKYGVLQMVADVGKMITKEMIVPASADKLIFFIAPGLAIVTSALLFAVMPFGPDVIGVDLNVGVFYVLSISSISVVAILLAGWGSNNKYALLGAFRSVAQLVSYEVPMILSLLVPIILARSMSTVDIVDAQAIPFFFYAPLASFIFFISSLAETGRSPFDLLEAESEIVSGFHTEYTGMVFGLFMAAEYMAIMFMCGLYVTTFWSGYRFFGLEEWVLANGFVIGRGLGLVILTAKASMVFFVFMWIRATLPRFRIDQMLNFNWKFMVPLTIALIFTVAIVDKVIQLLPEVNEISRVVIHLASNVVIGLITLAILRSVGRRNRLAAEAAQRQEIMPDVAAAD